ncbi:hypothetical protein SAMN05444680_109133 [Variovorax sp. YR216]|nr:hypothetical protein SAMN05444680_109133 [Variovorax sp. YR216]
MSKVELWPHPGLQISHERRFGNPATASGKTEGWNLSAYGTWYQNYSNSRLCPGEAQLRCAWHS